MLSFIKMACLIKLKETKTSSKYGGEGASSVLAVLTSLGLRGSALKQPLFQNSTRLSFHNYIFQQIITA